MKAYKNLYVCCRENGDKIINVDSVEEGREIIKGYEHDDKLEGTYEPDFYAICELDENDRYVIETVE